MNMGWITWVSFVGLLWMYPVCNSGKQNPLELKKRLSTKDPHFVIVDNFAGFITAKNRSNLRLIVFLQKNQTQQQSNKTWGEVWPQMLGDFVGISEWHIRKNLVLYVLKGRCNGSLSNITGFCPTYVCNKTLNESCQIRRLDTRTVCQNAKFDENVCKNKVNASDPRVRYRYFINITATATNCLNCDNPVQEPDTKIKMNVTIQTEDGGNFNAAEAAGIMNKMADLAKAMNESSAALTVAEGVTGILVKTEEAEPADIREVSIAYSSPNDNMNIIGDKDTLATFSRSVTVSKEALTKCSLENGTAFSAVLRFLNLTSDEKNSTVLGNEVIAVEMGTTITNLTDKMKINFLNMKYKGIPSCHSWNGEGSRPNWTDDGCQTKFDERNIFCECSHLTFFAILMTPLNETISSSDLNNLTIITQVGCGLSIFFLSIVLFMHFLLRKTKASNTTTILIHLVSAMSLLNFAFLINSYVANLKSSVICKIMAALMHYFMLATFTWFAVQAFHLCLQLYAGGQIVIRHYILKVSIVSWVLPSVVGIVLLILGKYGEQLIHTNDSDQTVAMCWITDNLVHYVVNIGYYVSVFIFTFTTFILILSRLFFLKKANTNQKSTNGKSIVIILGLCCMLGITWGFAFFAYGALRIPSYYIFTVLNSFQGFFLFIYYYNTSSGDITGGASNHKNSNSVNTIKTSLDSFENPYTSPPKGLKSNEKVSLK
ncbi:adhesion G protein-coupled receptor G3 isoform X2 [Etheostoma spectabile]|uniref:adhesion G protein-coupled receptor G3 isoform X2 n=1 Tax=Etheostoma spectabile TaxID=54343 RepID=UPI0013AF3EE4|nr:adhesion G protein-coupled receptor G3-like isoform X2 [Etheostoma spectabile]